MTTTASEAPAVPAARAANGDGDLVAVPPPAADKAGLKCRVLIDPRVWDDCVTWTEADTTRKGIALDEDARLYDILWLAACALQEDCAEGTAGRPGALAYTVPRVPRAGDDREARNVTLTVTAARSRSRKVTVTIGPGPDGGR